MPKTYLGSNALDDPDLAASQVTSGTFDDARIPAGITRDTELDTVESDLATAIADGDASTLTSANAHSDGKVTQTITNGVTTTAPSEDAVFDALALKAPLASPTFTGTPAAPTAAQGTNTTQVATTAYVQTEVGLLVPKSLFDANTMLYATTDNTPAALTVGASTFVGRKASGDISAMSVTESATLLRGVVGGIPVVVRKAADESVNNSTVLQNDDHLTFAIGATEEWVIQYHLFITCTSAAADFKCSLNAPAGATGKVALHAAAPANTLVQGDMTSLSFAGGIGTALDSGVTASGSAAPAYSIYTASIATTGTSGNVVLQWAQVTATAVNTTLQAGSFLVAHRVA